MLMLESSLLFAVLVCFSQL